MLLPVQTEEEIEVGWALILLHALTRLLSRTRHSDDSVYKKLHFRVKLNFSYSHK